MLITVAYHKRSQFDQENIDSTYNNADDVRDYKTEANDVRDCKTEADDIEDRKSKTDETGAYKTGVNQIEVNETEVCKSKISLDMQVPVCIMTRHSSQLSLVQSNNMHNVQDQL